MRELFQDMGEHLAVYDHTAFERALLALIEEGRHGRAARNL